MATTLLSLLPTLPLPILRPLTSSALASSTSSKVLLGPFCSVERREPLGISIGLRNQSKRWRLWKPSASSGEALPTEAVVEKAQEIVPAVTSTEDGGIEPIIISGLLALAFVGLFVLTAGVIYIAVTDFMQKREKEKFEKEEATNNKRRNKKKVKKPSGPRGFG